MKRSIKLTGIFILLLVCIIISILIRNNNGYTNVLKEYSESGKLIGTNEFIIKNGDTIMHGKYINYNESGIKISEGQFVNNEVQGKCIYYYDNGKIESIQYRKTNKIIQESTEYYPNEEVKRYTMFDPFGLEAFIARYDEKGNIKNYEGYPLMEIYQYPIANKERFKIKINQHLKVGDTLRHNYLVANIPNAKRSFTIENVGVENAKVKRITKKIEPCQIDIKEVLTKKGKNTIRSIVKYEFNNKSKSIFSDTLTFEVNVN
jgi:hypothetical protein